MPPEREAAGGGIRSPPLSCETDTSPWHLVLGRDKASSSLEIGEPFGLILTKVLAAK